MSPQFVEPVNGYSDEYIEAIARIICKHNKLDPDAVALASLAQCSTHKEIAQSSMWQVSNVGHSYDQPIKMPQWKLFRQKALDLILDDALREEVRAHRQQHYW